MEQKMMGLWMKAVIIGVGLCLLACCFYLIPEYGKTLAARYMQYKFLYGRWMGFIWISAVPCFAVLVLGWMLAHTVGKGKAFTQVNVTRLRLISRLAAADTVFFFLGNVFYAFMGWSHPVILSLSMLAVLFGVVIASAAAVLAYLVCKAADLQIQADLTI